MSLSRDRVTLVFIGSRALPVVAFNFALMETGENSFKACNQCKRFVPAHDIRKTCEKCRAKSRERSRVKKLALAAQLKNLPPAQNQSMLKKCQAEDIPNTSNKAPKKLAPVTVSAPGTSVFSSTDVNWRVSCTIKPEEPPTLQYQKASCLYDAIKETASSTPSCTFVGCHSIIRCDNIDHTRREQIVASDLRKIVKIPFRSVFFNLRQISTYLSSKTAGTVNPSIPSRMMRTFESNIAAPVAYFLQRR
jgi:hypothetical protein